MAPEIEVARAIADIFAALERLHEQGAGEASGSRVRREAVHYLWELRAGAKLAETRTHSLAARAQRRRGQVAGLEYDHSIPVACFMPVLRRSLASPEMMLHALQTYVQPVVLTSEEHNLLATQGLRSKMPDYCELHDALARYRSVGITIEASAEGDEHLRVR